MVEIRRALHRHRELAFEEERTAQTIIEELERLGISYSYSGKGGAVIGRLHQQHVAAIFGGHVTHHYRVGEIMVAEGAITAQSDRFTIRVQGRGEHSARPQDCRTATCRVVESTG
jgi:metal-dependent amidase/aminoacylase/carboxypeptidase family protein